MPSRNRSKLPPGKTPDEFAGAYKAMIQWAKERQLQVVELPLKPGHVGEFDGKLFVLDPSYPLDERTYFLAHAIGSAVIWFMDDSVSPMFSELRDAKKDRNSTRFEWALAQYQAFEIQSSQFAVWLLRNLGFAKLILPYSNFMQADLESMTVFHQTGQAPAWQKFFAEWNAQVEAGNRIIEEFSAIEIPQFSPRQFETQEILQQQ